MDCGVVSVNTQARRLGCFLFLLKQIATNQGLEALLLDQKSDKLQELKSNIVSVGLASGYLTKNRSSVIHYLDAAQQLRLIVQRGALYELTSQGRFLVDVTGSFDRPYPLSGHSRRSLLHAMISTDYYGMQAIVQSLLAGARSVRTIRSEHQEQLIHVLKGASMDAANSTIRSIAHDRLLTIKKWRKPDAYAEHLVFAKVNWLIDLGIVTTSGHDGDMIERCSDHEKWLHDYACSVEPSISTIYSFVLNYACAETETVRDYDERLEAVLCAAFSLLGGKANAMNKIRCGDLACFIVCCRPAFLKGLIERGASVFPDATVVAGGMRYTVHSASRTTQGYVTRIAL